MGGDLIRLWCCYPAFSNIMMLDHTAYIVGAYTGHQHSHSVQTLKFLVNGNELTHPPSIKVNNDLKIEGQQLGQRS